MYNAYSFKNILKIFSTSGSQKIMFWCCFFNALVNKDQLGHPICPKRSSIAPPLRRATLPDPISHTTSKEVHVCLLCRVCSVPKAGPKTPSPRFHALAGILLALEGVVGCYLPHLKKHKERWVHAPPPPIGGQFFPRVNRVLKPHWRRELLACFKRRSRCLSKLGGRR